MWPYFCKQLTEWYSNCECPGTGSERKKERKKETNACLGGIGRLLAPQRRENPRPCTTRKDGAPRDTLEDRLSATRRKKKQIPQCVRDDSGGEGAVANILEVGDADFTGVKAVGGEVAEEGEEGYALAERGVFFGIFAVGNQVEDFFLLVWCALHEDIAVAVRAGGIQPEEPAAKLQLIFGVFAGEQIDEFRRAGFHRAPGFFILGDDGIAQKQERRVFCDGKIFWRVRARRSSSLLLVHHLVDVLGGLRGNNLQHRASGRAEGEGAKDVAAGYGFVRHGGPHNGKRKDLTQGAQRTQRAQRRRENGQWSWLNPVLSWIDQSCRDRAQHAAPLQRTGWMRLGGAC